MVLKETQHYIGKRELNKAQTFILRGGRSCRGVTASQPNDNLFFNANQNCVIRLKIYFYITHVRRMNKKKIAVIVISIIVCLLVYLPTPKGREP